MSDRTPESDSSTSSMYRLMREMSAVDGRMLHGLLTRAVGSNPRLSDLVSAVMMGPVLKLQRQTLLRGEEEVSVPFCGYQVHLDLRSATDYSAYVSFQRFGSYEPATVRELLSRIKPGDTFIDVGANSGILTIAAASRVGRGGHVIAFEPQPEARRRLFRNVMDNDLGGVVEVRREAVSDSVGAASMSISKVCDSLSGLRRVGLTDESMTVPTTTLDAAIAGAGPSVIKVDVEGGEEAVLRGARRTLAGFEGSRQPTLIIEWNSLYAGQSLWNLLWEHGKVYFLRDGKPHPEPASRSSTPWGRGCNLLVEPRVPPKE
jgi:FkbM family methyltransferase